MALVSKTVKKLTKIHKTVRKSQLKLAPANREGALLLPIGWRQLQLNLYCSHVILTINQPVDYMAWGFMIFMWGVDITRAIGRVGLKVEPVLGPKQAILSTQPFQWPKYLMYLPCIKILTAKCHIKKQVHWYF